MTNKTKILLVGGLLALGAAIPAIAQAGGDSETSMPDSRLRGASAAATENLYVVGSADDEAGAEDVFDEDEVGIANDVDTSEDTDAEDADDASAGDSEAQIVGPDLDRASAVAIAHLGGGRVTATEIEDEESYYEVEVTLEDGSQVDVQLDENFNVVGSERDAAGDEG